MSASGKCSLGLLTPLESPNCLQPTPNEVLCALELLVGALVAGRLMWEMPRVSLSMRIMLSFYTGALVCVCAMCCVGLARVDDNTVAQYVLWTCAHVCYALGISTRMHVFVRAVYNASRQRVAFKTSPFSISNFALSVLFSLAIVVVWACSPLITPPGSALSDSLHRAGFIIWGVYTLILSISLFFVSRFIIGLYVGLVNNSDPSEKGRRQKGAVVLRHMTAVTCGAMFFSSFNYFLIGGVPGALRNEVAHAQFWLLEVAMLPLLRFVRQCAEIREDQLKRMSLRSINEPNSHSEKSISTAANSPGRSKPAFSVVLSAVHSSEPGIQKNMICSSRAETVDKATSLTLVVETEPPELSRAEGSFVLQEDESKPAAGPLRLSFDTSASVKDLSQESDRRLSQATDSEKSSARPSVGLLGEANRSDAHSAGQSYELSTIQLP